MADDSEITLARVVTKLLADLDFLFTVGKGPDGIVWTLGFEHEDTTEKVLVQLRFQENWLLVYNVTPAPDPLNLDIAIELLHLNTQVPIAKVGLQESNVVIAAQLLASRLDTESLKEAMGAVVSLAAQAYVALRKGASH